MKKYLVQIKDKILRLSMKSKLLLVFLSAGMVWFWMLLPDKLFNDPTSYVIEDENGDLLNASIAADGQWRFPYSKNIPEKFTACITTFEDKRFFHHPGIDTLSIARAV